MQARHVAVARNGVCNAPSSFVHFGSPEETVAFLEGYGRRLGEMETSENRETIMMEPWVWKCSSQELRHLLRGLFQQCGDSEGRFRTRSAHFRDDLVRVLLLAGFPASFHRDEADGTFVVSFADDNMRHPVAKASENHVRRREYSGRVWCFTMPSGLFWVRRVTSVDACSGVVLEASQPVVTGNCGTVEYMAPEMVQGNDYGKEVDWWSLGILLFDMLSGSPPWTHENEKTLCDMILNAKLVMPAFLSESCKSLLKGLLQREPEKRFDAASLQSHPFFEGLDWTAVLEKEIDPPFVPAVPGGDLSTLNFDDKYIKRKNVAATTPSDHLELSKSEDALFQGFSFVRDPSAFGTAKK